MPEETKNTPALTVAPQAAKASSNKFPNWFLPILLVVSIFTNLLLVGLYNQGKTKEAPYVDMSEAFPQNEEGYVSEDNNYDEGLVNSESLQEIFKLTADLKDYSIYYKNLIKQGGVIWFDLPKILPDQNLVTVEGHSIPNYLQVGTRDGEPIVFIYVPCDCLINNSYMFFVVHDDGTSTYIQNNSSVDLTSEWSSVKLRSGVKTDTNFSFLSLHPEETIITPDSIKLSQGLVGVQIHSETYFNKDARYSYDKIEFITETPFGPLFRGYDIDKEAGTADYVYAIRLPGGLNITYDEASLGFMTDDRVPQITWTDGEVNNEPYRGDRLTGCGGGGPEVLVDPLREPKIERVGTTKTGEAVYNVIDPTHPLITRIFEMTDGVIYVYDPKTGESTNRVITPAEFIAKRGVLLVESLGRQLVFTNTKYGPQAECGKPVIYLYPEATTTIRVSVDALVTKSEPLYEENGWVATAHPDGSLIVNGQPYTSLFWDGYGNGVYPEIKQGFVVPTSEVLAAMSDHLRYIGFNEFEISEFVAFWSDHLPEETYTRFSWLQTVEMERLARLTIDPRPDTLIRAFVDYEGVDEMIEIEPQKLIKRARNGYVVTEWGGLLRK